MSKLLDKAPDIRDLEIRSGLDKLCEKDDFFNKGNDNNNKNNNFFIPPPPPPTPPEFSRQNFPPPLPHSPNLNDFFLDNYIRSPLLILPPLPPPQPRNLTFKNDIGTNTTPTLFGDHLI